jgi:hypothetical protein
MVDAGAGGSAALGERRRDALVGRDPPASARRLIDRAAHDGVAEAEAARHVGVADEVGPAELVQGVEHLGFGAVGRGCGELELERVAGHRGAVEHRPRVVGQQRELLGEGGGDRWRHAQAGERHLGPGRRARDLRGTGQLLEVEGVAAALLVQRLHFVADKRLRFLAAERVERQALERPVAVCAVKGAVEPRGQLVGPRSEREQHPGSGGPVQQRDEQVDRCGVGPVEVVEHEHERLGGRELFEQLPDRTVGPVALVHGGLSGPGRSGQRRQHLSEPGPHQIVQPIEAARVEALDVLVERVDEDPERQVLFELRACARQDCVAPVLRAPCQLSEQARLADPRGAGDLDRPRLAALERLERVVEELELGGAAYE